MKSILSIICFTLFVSSCYSQAPRTLNFINNCNQTVWVGALNNPGRDLPSQGGWAVGAGQMNSLEVPYNWAGRFWGRTGCSFDENGNGRCDTGDCGAKLACSGAGGVPPVSLMEFTFSGAGGLDFYDVSLVDGYNLPVEISPVEGTYTSPGNAQYHCGTITCVRDLNEICPPELQIYNAAGQVIACTSACMRFNTDEYCCRNEYGTPDKCPPTPYSQIFKEACPDAYSYAYDDHTSTYTCIGASYNMVFCPTSGQTTPSLPAVSQDSTPQETEESSTSDDVPSSSDETETDCSAACGTTLSCCAAVSGNACYDPQFYGCAVNELNQNVLCPTGYNACGTACFSPDHYSCAS